MSHGPWVPAAGSHGVPVVPGSHSWGPRKYNNNNDIDDVVHTYAYLPMIRTPRTSNIINTHGTVVVDHIGGKEVGSQHFTETMQVCFAYQRGGCDRGDSCRFAHEGGGSGGQRGGPARRMGDRVCYAYQKGECDRGGACRFSHDSDGGGGGYEGSL